MYMYVVLKLQFGAKQFIINKIICSIGTFKLLEGMALLIYKPVVLTAEND